MEVCVYCGAIMPDGISPYLKIYITSETDMVVGYIGDMRFLQGLTQKLKVMRATFKAFSLELKH